MDSNEASKTLLLKGKRVEFPEKQAERILDLQKRTGTTDYKEAAPDDEPQATEPQTDSNDASNGPTGDPINPDTAKRGSTKKGG